MNTGQTLLIKSTSSKDTESIGEHLGQNLRGGETIELISDLGGGKTTFVRGLVRGANSTDKVASPTFTISKLYKTPKFNLHHFDFYRLNEAGIVANEIAEAADDPNNVVIVEWGDVVADVLPANRLKIYFKRTGDNSREVSFVLKPGYEYLIKGVK